MTDKPTDHKALSLKKEIQESILDEKNNEKPYSVFNNQAGGHSRIYYVENGKIAKRCNPVEASFYQRIPSEPLLEPHVPKYFEIRHIENIKDDYLRDFHNPGEFIILENLTGSYNHPCVMDLKLGNINYNANRHNINKIRYRKLKLNNTTSGKYGVRLSAIKVYRPYRFGNYFTLSSKFPHRLHTESHLKNILELYLHDGYRIRTELIPPMIHRLKLLLHALNTQTTFEFYSSSVLLLYEGDPENLKEGKVGKVDLRIIDFDHAEIHPEPKLEDRFGTAVGISSLISVLKKILYSSKRTKSDTELQTHFLHHIPRIKRVLKQSSLSEEEN